VQLPFEDGRHAPITVEDQARVIASILEQPAGHEGQIYGLFGPREYTYPETFALIARLLGRDITYQRISYEEYYAQLEKQRGPFFAQHITEVAKDHANSVFSGTNDVIEKITGQPPMGLEEFITQNRQVFA